VTGENFDLPIQGELKLLVKFGEEFNNENEELLILPHGEYQFNIAQYIYEMIVLSVPQKRVHPTIAASYEPDSLDEDELDFLDDWDEEFDDDKEEIVQVDEQQQ